MNTASHYFAIFSLPQSWEIDANQLEVRFRRLQQQFHPDRFASNSEIEKRRAMEMAATINQAHQTLKDPLSRAQYLLELQGCDVNQDSQITSDGQFLMAQMMQRETLAEIRESATSDPDKSRQALQSLSGEAQRDYLSLQQQFSQQFQVEDYSQALDTLAKMQFAAKFANEIIEFKNQLEDQ